MPTREFENAVIELSDEDVDYFLDALYEDDVSAGEYPIYLSWKEPVKSLTMEATDSKER